MEKKKTTRKQIYSVFFKYRIQKIPIYIDKENKNKVT
jgi:hypothetical protein